MRMRRLDILGRGRDILMSGMRGMSGSGFCWRRYVDTEQKSRDTDMGKEKDGV